MPKRFIKNKRRASKRTGLSFAQRVQKVVNKSQETKKAVYESGIINFNSQINAAGDILRILPQIAKGTNSWERTGQSIRLMKVVVKGYYALDNTADSANDVRLNIRHMFLANKQKSKWNDNGVNDLLQLLEKANGVSQQFDGTVARYMTPINREQFTSRGDKKLPMSTIYINSNAGFAAPPANSVRYFTKTLTFGKNGKNIHFEASDEGLNFPYFHCLGYCHADGTGPDTVSTRLKMCYTATAYYKDA